MTSHLTLGAGGEFDAIRSMLAEWGPAARGIGDDAALIDVPAGERLVVSTDVSVDEVHFRRAWITPGEIGWRATMAALSDLAAMAARPLGALVAITIPDDQRALLPRLVRGIGAAAMEVGTVIVGGDLSRGATLSLSVTALGSAKRPLERRGARPGDALWVTGRLGGPGSAVRQWESGGTPDDVAREGFVMPVARIEAAQWLAAAGATAGIDISDGLVADARHLAAASGVQLTMALESVPCLYGISPRDAVVSGEEYELLVSGPPTLDTLAFITACGLPLTCIGHVAAGPASVVVTEGGARVEIAGGHDHFSA